MSKQIAKNEPQKNKRIPDHLLRLIGSVFEFTLALAALIVQMETRVIVWMMKAGLGPNTKAELSLALTRERLTTASDPRLTQTAHFTGLTDLVSGRLGLC